MFKFINNFQPYMALRYLQKITCFLRLKKYLFVLIQFLLRTACEVTFLV